ncbi:MAG: 30S ribosomal protein S11, partial [Candidatus Krumholzibacteria bacterium]|nr:30S ribosomal protein S11 [Candidatus Krumholzibacteria bacterium]
VHIKSSFNNTIITVTNRKGEVQAWASSGTAGFKGSRKSTPFAAQLAAEKVVREAMNAGLRSCEIHLKGPGPGREAAIRSVHATGIEVTGIRDKTSMPHNGCRPTKRRRN